MVLAEAKAYLKVDFDDDDDYIEEIIVTSQNYIEGMVGVAYKTDEKAVSLAVILQKKLIYDMYENRGTEIPNNTKQDRIVNSIMDKLSNYADI